MKTKNLLLLGILCTGLFACDNNVSESSSLPSSSTSLGPKSSELEEKMLKNLSSAYEVVGIFTAKVKEQVSYTNYYEYKCSDKVYEFKSYEEVKENPTRDVLTSSYRYEGFYYGETEYLTQAKLTLNNEVINYLVTDSSYNLLLWDSTGFSNVFKDLSIDNFEKTDNEYEFSLKMNDMNLFGVYQSITSQFSSYMGLELTSFAIKTDGYNIKEYEAVFAPLASQGGQLVCSVAGEFVNYGEDLVKPIEVIQGNENVEFKAAMDSLKTQNYNLKVELVDRTYEVEVENGEKIIWDQYNRKGNKVSSYGYYTYNDRLIQGVTRINGNIYHDKGFIEGSLASVVPTFSISSVFFNLSDKSTADKKIFTYREDVVKASEIGYYYDYGMLGGSNVGQLTITIENDKITIENQLQLGKEIYTYSNIGKVNNLFSVINKKCDNLTWSELASNNPIELEKMYNSIPKEILDSIPTPGGMYSQIEVDASTNPLTPVFAFPVTTSDAAVNIYAEMCTKLANLNFVFDEENSKDLISVYNKEIEVNNEVKTLSVKIQIAIDFLKGVQVLIYPSII